MGKKPDLPPAMQALVDKVGDPVTADDIDLYAKLQHVRDQSHRVRTIVNAWKKQQNQDRTMRGRYALALIIALLAQAIVINVIFILIGDGKLTYEPWTARIFIMAVFGELSSMVFFIVKYLFRPTADRVLELASDPPAASTASRRSSKKG
jgi:hypothetical protein